MVSGVRLGLRALPYHPESPAPEPAGDRYPGAAAMIRWAMSWKYTILASCLLLALVAWLVLTGQSWEHWLYAVACGALYGWRGIGRSNRSQAPEPAWNPPGPSLPCPPDCRIRVEHRHDRLYRSSPGKVANS
jgi:hypothetical protein